MKKIEEKFYLKNKHGLKIFGVLEKPKGKILGTAIIQHGWGSSKKSSTIQALKNGFLESDFQTFCFDSTHSFGESDGDYQKSTLQTFSDDLEDVISWAENQEWFEKPLILSGHSKGGYSVLRYSENNPEKIFAVVSVAPVISGKLSFEANMERDKMAFEKWKEDGIRKTIGKNGNIKIANWWQMEERLNHDLLPDSKNLIIPTLLIVGDKDNLCPLKHQKILFEKILSKKKELKVFEGIGHSFRTEEECEKISNSVESFQKKLKDNA